MDVNSQDELFCQVDKNDKLIGSVSRYLAHSHPKYIHRSICILVLNNKNELLLQKRSTQKDTYPGYWTLSTTGHITHGQTYLQAAKRELFEEVSLTSHLRRRTKLLLTLPNETEYSTIYQTKITSETIKFNPEEISDITWVNITSLPTFISQNLITPDALQILHHLQYL